MLRTRGVSTRLAIVVMVAASLAACGRRGDPVAPVAATAPAETVETATPPTP